MTDFLLANSINILIPIERAKIFHIHLTYCFMNHIPLLSYCFLESGIVYHILQSIYIGLDKNNKKVKNRPEPIGPAYLVYLV